MKGISPNSIECANGNVKNMKRGKICRESKHGTTNVCGLVYLRVTLNKRSSQHCNILRIVMITLQRNATQNKMKLNE